MVIPKKRANRYIRFAYLKALPAEEYVMRHGAECKVQKNYHIVKGEDRHQYSVPFAFIGKKVQVVYDLDVVEVFYQHKRIALHRPRDISEMFNRKVGMRPMLTKLNSRVSL